MKFSVNWLREIVNPAVTNDELVEQLTMLGLEVEAIEPACINFSGVYTAEITSVEQHPNADKLKVCTVSLNEQSYNIVCGDPTVSVGSKVALATIGAKLQNGSFKIKKSKLRGVESQGMLCSLQELGLADSSEGIWVMPNATETGLELYQHLQLDDQIIELSLTPNRGDCFSLRGVAREAAIINNLDFNDLTNLIPPKAFESLESAQTQNININIEDFDACPVYSGRVIKNLDAHAVTPVWMKERLRRSGIRSLYPLVDVTNYVMLELGQPMHAFDLGRLGDTITVRKAASKEQLTLLDGNELELSETNLLICDESGPLALAGVMGGEKSGISETTTDVFLESANFSPEVIAKTARQFNIITDSSQRFERGVDPELTQRAIARATHLLVEIAGTDDTQIGTINNASTSEKSALAKVVSLRSHRVKRVLGIELAANEIEKILQQLGLGLKDKNNTDAGVVYQWEIPSYRYDLNIEEDLIEELARIHGYNNIPNNLPKRSLSMTTQNPRVALQQKIREVLVGHGYLEALTYSFIDSNLQHYFSQSSKVVKLVNPISSEMGELRLSLCPGLIKAAEYNYNHKVESIKLFEIGKCFYLNDDQSCDEQTKLAGILVGNTTNEDWSEKSRQVDFYDTKGELEQLFLSLGLNNIEFVTQTAGDLVSGLHPGRTAAIYQENKHLGWLGVIHPQVKNKLKIDSSIVLFEINLDILHIPSYNKYKAISKYPQIRRDLAFLFKNEIKMQNLYDIVESTAGDLLRDIFVFDIYQGEGVPDGYKSIAFAMVLQHCDKTLVDAEIKDVVDSVIKRVTKDLGGRLRE